MEAVRWPAAYSGIFGNLHWFSARCLCLFGLIDVARAAIWAKLKSSQRFPHKHKDKNNLCQINFKYVECGECRVSRRHSFEFPRAHIHTHTHIYNLNIPLSAWGTEISVWFYSQVWHALNAPARYVNENGTVKEKFQYCSHCVGGHNCASLYLYLCLCICISSLAQVPPAASVVVFVVVALNARTWFAFVNNQTCCACVCAWDSNAEIINCLELLSLWHWSNKCVLVITIIMRQRQHQHKHDGNMGNTSTLPWHHRWVLLVRICFTARKSATNKNVLMIFNNHNH